MAVHTGFSYPDIISADFATLSPSVSGGSENNFQTQALIAEQPLFAGSKVEGTTTPQPLSTAGAFLYQDFFDLWYNRIHILPSRIDVGNLTSEQIRPVEIFNSHFVSETLNTVAGTTVEGTALDIVTPETYAPLQSHIHNLTISTTGAPNFAGFYTLTFDVLGDFLLIVSGKRVLPIAFQHNWSETDGGEVIERLAYLTNILPSKSGIEQAIMVRQYPRRTLEYKFLLASTQTNAPRLRALWQALMFGWQHRTFAVPIWTDATRLQAQADAGQPFIQVSTAFFDYDIGNYIMLWQDEENYEILEIQDMDTGTITATVNLTRTWPATRTVVLPARLGVVAPSIIGSKHTVDIDTVPMAFEILPQAFSTNRVVAGARIMYRGIDVLMETSNYDDTNDFQISRELTRHDADVGYFSIDAQNNAPQTNIQYDKIMANHQQSSDFFAWLDTRKGRFTPVWLPTWSHDFEVVDNISNTATAIVVNEIGYASLYMATGTPPASRRDVMVRLKTGTYYFKRITGAANNLDGTETISLDSAFGVSINASDIDRVCFLVPSRLDADAVEIAWVSGNVSRTAFKVTDLVDDQL
jgi:hypothetical protein